MEERTVFVQQLVDYMQRLYHEKRTEEYIKISGLERSYKIYDTLLPKAKDKRVGYREGWGIPNPAVLSRGAVVMENFQKACAIVFKDRSRL